MSEKIPDAPLKTTFNVTYIKEHVIMINEHIKKMEKLGKKDVFEFEMELLEVFPEFYDAHPSLVKKLCKKEDISFLYKMLENLDQVEKGNKSIASVEMNLGQELAGKFLYPAINKK
jgi:hypothetical protein